MECAEAVADPARAWWLPVLEHGSRRWDIPVCGDRHDAVTWTLEPRPRAAAAAREISMAVLREWRMVRLASDVELVVSELVTNALRHGVPLSRTPTGRGGIQFSLMRSGGEFICAVRDAGNRMPHRREPDLALESGRGLALVSSFARGWGVIPTSPTGKFVWAQFS